MERTSYLAALIGAGVGPSLTPPMHERAGRRHGLSYVYRTVDLTVLGLTPESVGELLEGARRLGFDGLNITHPCKQLVIPHLDGLSPEAESVRAVNTVVFADGTAWGHNTDVPGFAKSFARGLPGATVGTVVQVGAGGAGAAAAHALCNLGAGRLLIADLDPERSRDLARSLQAGAPAGTRVEHLPLAGLAAALASADGLVNATPLGMAAHPRSAVAAELLRPEMWVADVVYRPLRTPLLRDAERAGCRVLTGAGMAVYQAVDAFALITGRQPDPDAMFTDFQDLVSHESRTDATAES